MGQRRTVSVTPEELAAIWALADEASTALHDLVPDSEADAAAASVVAWLDLLYRATVRAAETKLTPGQLRIPGLGR